MINPPNETSSGRWTEDNLPRMSEDPSSSAPHPSATPILPRPDRVTLTPPVRSNLSPFQRYYATAPEAPRPVRRAAWVRLGISEETFNRRVTQEINEALREMAAERALARITEGASVEFPRVLSKEDCLTLFNATGVLTSGSLYGVYRWAADLDIPKFNFDTEPVGDDYSFLNAYD